ncbi:MBL fold metallo-hydrolase [Planctomycetaceae bacterium]|nr:MBL fold metallo-hydrolase [Planctomycetaceae bacterium]
MTDSGSGKRFVVACVVLVVVVSGLALWRGSSVSPVFRNQATRLAGRVYLLGRLGPSVAYVVDTSDGLVLVDSGVEPDCQLLLSQVDELGLDVRRLKKILLTHAHVDHVQGAMYLRRLTGARVFAGRADCDSLRAGGPASALFSTYEMPGVELHTTEIDVELDGGEVITSGDCRFEVIATPGHTPGSLCFVLQSNGQRVLFSGDTVSSITGDLGTDATRVAPRYRADAGDYLATLKKLKALPPPDLLFPGHPRTIGRGEGGGVNAAITPTAWRRILDAGIAEMQELVERHRADGADFLDGTPRELIRGLFYLGDYDDTACYLLDDQGRLFLFGAHGGPGLVKFLETRLARFDRRLADVAAVLPASCSVEATAGLSALLRRLECPVVVSRAGRGVLETSLPAATRFLVLEDTKLLGLGPIEGIPLGGYGVAPVAFRFEREGKRVLVAGGIPANPDSPREMRKLIEVFGGGHGDVTRYGQSLSRILREKPDLWLPSRPVHGQNANLYDVRWPLVIRENRNAISRSLER